MNRNRIKTGRRIRLTRLGLSLPLFLTLVSMSVLARIITVTVVASPSACHEFRDLAVGTGMSAFDGPMEWVGWIGAATLVLIGVMTGIALVQKNWTRMSLAIGIVNCLFAVLLIFLSLQFWAYFSPTDRGAETLNRFTDQFVDVYFFQIAPYEHDRSFPWQKEELGWKEQTDGSFFHSDLRMTARFEQVSSCFTDAFQREQFRQRGLLKNISPDDQLHNPRSEWVFYDLKGRMLVDGRRFFTVDEMFDKKLKTARRNPSPINYQEFLDEQFIAEYDWYLAHRNRISKDDLHTREEIEKMVQRTWDREAPIEE